MRPKTIRSAVSIRLRAIARTLCLAAATLAGCAVPSGIEDGRPVLDVYLGVPSDSGAPPTDVNPEEGPRYVRPGVEILSGPAVWPIWIPAHVTAKGDLLVDGHWVYLRLSGGRWFIEEPGAMPDRLVLPDSGRLEFDDRGKEETSR